MPIDEEGWEDIDPEAGWEDVEAAPPAKPNPPSNPFAAKPKPLPEERVGAMDVAREVPGVLADYGIGALKGAGRLLRGVVQMDPLRPNAALNFDPMRAQKAREIDELLGLSAKGGVQELGGAIPYLAANPQGAVGNAALAGAGAYLETQDPSTALKSAALGGVAGKIPGIAKKLGGKLMGSAVNQYEKALHPTTRAAKVETDRIVPELLRRRVSGSIDDLVSMGTQKSDDVGQKIGAAYAKSPKTVDASQIADGLESLKNPFIAQSGAGKSVVMDDAAVAKIDEIQKKLREFGPDVSPENLWKYRQVLDRVVRASGGFTKELSKESAAEISKGARQAVQAELTSAVPNVQRLNAEYRLWEALQDVAGETAIRKTGQQGLAPMLARGAGAATGATVGAVVGGPYAAAAGGMAGAQATKKIADLMASPRWRTTSAVNKARVSDFLASGDTQRALELINRLLTSTAASSASPAR
jgi:hypothetical protein